MQKNINGMNNPNWKGGISSQLTECPICNKNRVKYQRKTCSVECSKILLSKINSKNRSNEKNGMWKGDDAGLIALHEWVRRRKPKPEFCENCKKNPPIDLANISGEYKRDVNDFKWLCRKCHMIEDGRLEKFVYILKTYRKKIDYTRGKKE